MSTSESMEARSVPLARSMLAGFGSNNTGSLSDASVPSGRLPRRLLVTSTQPPSPAMAPSSSSPLRPP
ncbi:hypothetical protein FF1_026596 [Malus domestica]